MSDEPLAGQADASANSSFAPAVDPFATFEVPTNGVVLELSDVNLDSPVSIPVTPTEPVAEKPAVEVTVAEEPSASITQELPIKELPIKESPVPKVVDPVLEPPAAKPAVTLEAPSEVVADQIETAPTAEGTAEPVIAPLSTEEAPPVVETVKVEAKAADPVLAPPKAAAVAPKVTISHRTPAKPVTPPPAPEVSAKPEPVTPPPVMPEPTKAAAPKVVVKKAASAAPAPTPPKPAAPKTSESVNLFSQLDLIPEVQAAIERNGYTTPTEIQAQIIPYMLDGRDVLAQSQTGTGKTAAFALPILSRIDLNSRRPQILVLTPTRELAIQVGRSFETYGADLHKLNVATIYGGSDYHPQLRALKQGAQVVVGTPGRTIDHINRGTLKLDGITCLALDEADEMLNMGFLDDVKHVLEHTPDDRQVALFSATMPGPIRTIAQNYLNDPARITVKAKTMTAASIRQRAVITHPRTKVDALLRFLEFEDSDGAIVFTKTREATVSVADSLIQNGLRAVALNGDMPQKVRERTIEQLKNGRLDVLVATDVAARGLDVSRISHVFNYDVPQDNESYIHRIGRTGRAGRKGEAIIFLSKSQRYKLRQIERATRQPIEVVDPPTADQLNGKRVASFKQKISEVMEATDLAFFHKLITEHAEESGKPVEYIAAALAHLGQGGRPFFVQDRPQFSSNDHSDRDRDRGGRDRGRDGDRRGGRERYSRDRDGGERGGGDRGGRGPRQLSTPEPGMERFRIEVGRRDGVKPGNIVGAVANEGGLDGSQIGPIAIHDSHSTVDLPAGMPSEVYQTLRQTRVAGKPLKLARSTEEAGSEDSSDRRPGKRFGGKRYGGKPKSGGPSRFGGKGKFRKRKHGDS